MKNAVSQNLIELVPDLFTHKSVLYIGARLDRFEYLYEFKNSDYKIDILEIYKENFDYFKSLHPAYSVLTKKSMLEGLSAKIHPGAMKYYKEAGLK